MKTNMSLREYLETKKINQTEAARVLCVQRVYLNAILNGRAAPSPMLRKLIWYWTGGLVTEWPDDEAEATAHPRQVRAVAGR